MFFFPIAFPKEFSPFTPGLEMKFALEGAEKLKSNVVLGGLAINDTDCEGLRVEPRWDLLSLFRNGKTLTEHNKLWYNEVLDNFSTLDVIIIIKKQFLTPKSNKNELNAK